MPDSLARPSAPPGPSPEPDPPPAIAVRGLTKRYGERVAVDALDLTVRRGRVTGFVGPNGAGKTTTIRMLLGLVAPTAGTGTVLDADLAAPVGYLERVGALIDGPAFTPALSARRNLLVLSRLGAIPEARVDAVLAQVGLADRAQDAVKGYSLGMRQRLGIAAALLPAPELLVLDEPTNGLDPAGIREVRGLLRGLADDGMTVLVSSHLLTEIEAICDDLVVLRQGRLLFDGPVGELLDAQRHTLRLRPERPEDLDALTRAMLGLGLESTRLPDGELVVTASAELGGAVNAAAHARGIVLAAIVPQQPSLEETFFAMTETGPEAGR